MFVRRLKPSLPHMPSFGYLHGLSAHASFMQSISDLQRYKTNEYSGLSDPCIGVHSRCPQSISLSSPGTTQNSHPCRLSQLAQLRM